MHHNFNDRCDNLGDAHSYKDLVQSKTSEFNDSRAACRNERFSLLYQKNVMSRCLQVQIVECMLFFCLNTYLNLY